MAATAAANKDAILVNTDANETLVLYKVHVESVATAVEMSVSTHPITRWFADHAATEFGAIAAVSGGGRGGGGTILGLVYRSRDTVVLDVATRSSSPGPRLRETKRRPAMLPVGDDTVVVMDKILRAGDRCCFEALRRVPGGWRAEPLPNPPVVGRHGDCFYTVAYFAVGTRVWISIDDAGDRGATFTFSLDVSQRGTTWRKEGDWVLSFRERALFVPELGSVFGLSDDREGCTNCLKRSCHHLCALDVEARPPVVRRMWEFPVDNREVVPAGEMVSLAYLGSGRFCMSRSVTVNTSSDPGTRFMSNATCFTVLDVTRSPAGAGDGELHLATRGTVHTHVWPHGFCAHADFL